MVVVTKVLLSKTLPDNHYCVKLSPKVDKYMKYDLQDILQSLNLHTTSQKIYKELLEHGETTARILSERLSLTRPSTYDHLGILKKKGLIVERKIDNKTYFALDDVRQIGTALEESISVLSEKKEMFLTMLPHLLDTSRTENPTIKFFEGKLGLTHLLNDILWNKGKTIYTMWPYQEMLSVLGKDSLVRFNNRRIQEKITIHALWPHGSKPSHDYIWDGKDVLTKRKYTKKNIVWTMGYTIYGDNVSFISSEKEIFGFIVHSQEFAKLMKLHFDVLWETSGTK